MTKKQNQDWEAVLASFGRQVAALARLPEAEQRTRLAALRAELKADRNVYYVKKYTVQAHFRRIPAKRKK